jgi:hypothetical protein
LLIFFVLCLVSRDDSSVYTYETIHDVEKEHNDADERAEDMVGVEVFTVEEEDEEEEDNADEEFTTGHGGLAVHGGTWKLHQKS